MKRRRECDGGVYCRRGKGEREEQQHNGVSIGSGSGSKAGFKPGVCRARGVYLYDAPNYKPKKKKETPNELRRTYAYTEKLLDSSSIQHFESYMNGFSNAHTPNNACLRIWPSVEPKERIKKTKGVHLITQLCSRLHSSNHRHTYTAHLG